MKNIYYLILILILILVLVAGCSKSKPELPDFNKMWDYNNPAETEVKFTEILSKEKKYDRNYYGQLLTQIARAQGLQAKFDEAELTLAKAEKFATDKYPTVKIRYMLEKGRILNSSGEGEQSIPIFLEAYNFGLEHNLDSYTLDAAHMLGFITPIAEQMEWNLKALTIAETTDDENTKRWLGSLYNNIGWTYHDLENYDKALELFQKGFDWRVEMIDESGARIAKWSVGRALRSLKRYDEALKIQLEIQDDFTFKKMEPDGYLLEELAELYLMKGQGDIARKYFQLAYEKLSQDQWLLDNEPNRINRLKDMGSK